MCTYLGDVQGKLAGAVKAHARSQGPSFQLLRIFLSLSSKLSFSVSLFEVWTLELNAVFPGDPINPMLTVSSF